MILLSMTYMWSLLCYIHSNNILYKYIRYRFRRIQIQCNMLYDIAPEEEDEIFVIY